MINVLKEGNLLIINEGTADAVYYNASWCSIDFSDSAVIITDNGGGGALNKSYTIAFTSFQYDSTPYSTKTTIATALSSVIG